MIFVRKRKFPEQTFNCSFFLVDGKELAHKEIFQFHQGDTVRLMFDITDEQRQAIADLERHDVRYYDSMDLHAQKYHVSIPFTVAKRSHAASWRETGHLQFLGTNITLEAVSGWWEDIFCWICLGEKPGWAD